jgi:6-phosphogluconolactonase (cycloisomerase 2 family)
MGRGRADDGGCQQKKTPRVKEPTMSTLHLHQTTTATPQQFLAALTDFGPDRFTIFPNSQDQHLQVHSRTATDADVTEGTGGYGNGCTTTGPTRPAS